MKGDIAKFTCHLFDCNILFFLKTAYLVKFPLIFNNREGVSTYILYNALDL